MGLKRRPLPKKTGHKRKRALDVEDRQLILEKKGLKKQKKLEYNAKLAESNKKQQAIRVAGTVHTQDIIRAIGSKPAKLPVTADCSRIDVSSVLSSLGVKRHVGDFGWSSDEESDTSDEQPQDDYQQSDDLDVESLQDEPLDGSEACSEDISANLHKRVSFPVSTQFTSESDSFFSALVRERDVALALEPFTGSVARSIYAVLSGYLLSHALKAGDRVRKNNKKTLTEDDTQRDQGPTRPRICIVCPFRSNGFELVSNFVRFAEKNETVEDGDSSDENSTEKKLSGLASFMAEYEGQDELNTHSKNWEDWRRELFKGHYDDAKYDDFVVGISFSFGKMKLCFPKNSQQICKNIDIIIGTPLGLSRIAAHDFKANRIKASQNEEEDTEDVVVMDFLASIEILVVDRIDALMMQNSKNTLDIIQATNQRPVATISADINRIELKFLDPKLAQQARQTVFISGSTLFEEYMPLVQQDRLELIVPQSYKGTSLNRALKQKVKQQFFIKLTNKEEFETYFQTKFWKDVGNEIRNLVIVVSETEDFQKVKEFLQEEGLLNCYLSEQDLSDIAGKRRKQMKQILKDFRTNQIRTIVVSERLLWYQRIRITGGRHALFYGPPKIDTVYADILADMVDPLRCNSTCIYSSSNKLEIERIAGTKNLAKLIHTQNTQKTTIFTPQ